MNGQTIKSAAAVTLALSLLALGGTAQAQSGGALVMSGRTKAQPAATPAQPAAPVAATPDSSGIALGERFMSSSRDWAVAMPATGWKASEPGKAFVILWGPDNLSVTVSGDYFSSTVQAHQEKFVADATKLGSVIESVKPRNTTWSKGYSVLQTRPSGRVQLTYNLLPFNGTRKGKKNGVSLEVKALDVATIKKHEAVLSAVVDSIKIYAR